ncbi:2-keto-4-pentenoate hydratase [Vibrio atlanticus]|uniref:2-keto-4-pentenoate hydratase n=1 Tax=Vibrio atlanticus TaxID=693153 RepID=UPI003D0E4543
MTSVFEQAANELLSRRIAGTKAPRLSERYRPTSLDDALAIQAAMVDLNRSKVGGWKCLLPLSEEKLIVAPIFEDSVQFGSECEAFSDNGVVRIEPEIAFVLAKPLPANSNGYTEEQVNEAIGSCRMALELIQSRFADDSGVEFYEVLADGLANQGLFLGPELSKESAFAAANFEIAITQDEKVQAFTGKHPNSLPQTPIYWLINTMTQRGVSFEAGEAIITGSYCGVVEVEFDQLTTVRYDELGEYEVIFKQKL